MIWRLALGAVQHAEVLGHRPEHRPIAVPLGGLTRGRTCRTLIGDDALARHLLGKVLEERGLKQRRVLLPALDRPHRVGAVVDGVLDDDTGSTLSDDRCELEALLVQSQRALSHRMHIGHRRWPA